MSPEHARLYQRPLARAQALTETWANDPTPITRAEAAQMLADAIDPNGWTETGTAPPRLAVVEQP